MTSFERKYNGQAMRAIKRLIDLGRSESQPKDPYCTCSMCELVDNSPADTDKLFSAGMLGICLVLAVLMLVAGCWATPAHAYTDEQAIKTIVGEASNQGLIGMTAVAEVIRHKGSLKGFYGFKASHSAHEPKWVWMMASKAWYASKTSNYTHMANHFENIHAFGCPYWVKSCVETFRYRDHIFYREVRRA